MITLTIPSTAVPLFWLALVCGTIALVALGAAAISREVAHWASDRAARFRRVMNIIRLVVLTLGAVLLTLAVMAVLLEIPRV